MPQYSIIARDFTDDEALSRRLKVRAQHFENLKALVTNGQFIKGGAFLNDKKEMCGSILLMEFDTREMLDDYLKNEVYVTGKVWDKIEIEEIKIAAV